MIQKIVHFADIQLYNDLKLMPHQRQAINNAISLIKQEKDIDRIVIVGDLFHDFLKPSNEVKSLVALFLRECALKAKTIITLGNHDFSAKSPDRLDSIASILSVMKNNNIHYYNSTGFYEDDNVVWCVWHHSDKRSPYIDGFNKDSSKIYIDLFHDPINGSKTYLGEKFGEQHVSINDFKGDYAFLGDIHQRQFFYKENKLFAAYPSSLFQNNIGESVDKHGFLVWDIINRKVKEVDVPTDYAFVRCHIPMNTDFDNLDLDIPVFPNTTLGIYWVDYSANMNNINRQKIKKYINDKYGECIKSIKFYEKKIPNHISNYVEEANAKMIDLSDTVTMQKLFKDFLSGDEYTEQHINGVLKLDNIISKELNLKNNNLKTDIKIKAIELENFKSFDRLELSWVGKHGIWQINGLNQVGKCLHPDTMLNVQFDIENLQLALGISALEDLESLICKLRKE